jgi:hypothetical protein
MSIFIRRIHLHNFFQQYGYSIGTGVEDVLNEFINKKDNWVCVYGQTTEWKQGGLSALKVEQRWVEQNQDERLDKFIQFTASLLMSCIKCAQRDKRKQVKASDMEFVLALVGMFLWN